MLKIMVVFTYTLTESKSPLQCFSFLMTALSHFIPKITTNMGQCKEKYKQMAVNSNITSKVNEYTSNFFYHFFTRKTSL